MCKRAIIFLDNSGSNATESQRKSSRSHKPVSYVEIDDANSNSPKVGTPTVDKLTDNEPPKDLPPVLPIERSTPEIGKYSIC